MAGIIIGGWDRQCGGSVYSITLGGSMVKQDFAIGGSGSTYVYGYCDANFKTGMSRSECQEFVRNGTCQPLLSIPISLMYAMNSYLPRDGSRWLFRWCRSTGND